MACLVVNPNRRRSALVTLGQWLENQAIHGGDDSQLSYKAGHCTSVSSDHIVGH